MDITTSRFPEWKALYDAIVPLVDAGEKTFSYDVLESLAGIDVRSDRGRLQFYRFRRELLKTKQFWMENIPAFGYTVVPAADQPKSAYKRIGSARRKVRMAKQINTFMRAEELTADQRCLHAATAAVLHELSKVFYSAGRKFQIASAQAQSVGVDLPELVNSIAKSK